MARPPKLAPNLDKPIRLTLPAIERLTCPPGREKAFMKDADVPGLKVRVTAAGSKSFVFQRKVGSTTMTQTIGSVSAWTIEQARTEARRIRVVLDTGDDPRELARKACADMAAAKAEKERQINFTFGALMGDYADQLERLGRISHAKVRGMVRKHLLEGAPALAQTPAADVTGEQIADLMRVQVEGGKNRTAGKLRAYIRAAYQMARTAATNPAVPVRFKGYQIKGNPASETTPPKPETDKNPLMAVQLRQYWQAIKNVEGLHGAALRLHLLTGGQRIEQLCRLRTEHVRERSITLIDGKGRPGKGPRAHQIPLVPAAQAALAELMAHTKGGEFVVSVDGGTSPVGAKSFAGWAKAAASGIEWEGAFKGAFQAKRVRSGVETTLASLRVSQEVRGHLLSHGVAGVQAASYDAHDYADVKREALETLFRHLENTSASVVHMATRVAA